MADYTIKVATVILTSSVANPTVITTAVDHGLVTGDSVVISGHTGSTPDINGTHTITKTGARTFTIAVNVTVGGTGGRALAPHTYQTRSHEWVASENKTQVLKFRIFSPDGSYLVSSGQEVTAFEDGNGYFGGIVIGCTLMSRKNDVGGVSVMNEVDCTGFGHFATYAYVTETVPAGSTLEDALDLLEPYLTDYGVSLDAGQVTGPTLDDEIVWGELLVSECLNQLAKITGYTWEIDYDKTLRMTEPGITAAPYDVEDGDELIGDVTVKASEQNYANRIYVKIGENGNILEKTLTATGDGSEDTFTLEYPVYSTRGYVTVDGVYETLRETTDPSGSATWVVDRDAGTITRDSGAPADDAVITFVYLVQFPISVMVEDTAAQTARGYVVAKTVTEPHIYDKFNAQTIGERALDSALSQARTVNYAVRGAGILKPGQTQNLSFAKYGFDADCTITEVSMRNVDDRQMFRYVTAVEGVEVLTPQARGILRSWLQPGTGGSSAQTQIATTTPVNAGGGTSTGSSPSVGSLIGVRRITTTGAYTYNATAGTRMVIVELQGAGGGGSGITSPGGSLVSIGRSGGGGGWMRKTITADFDGATGSVGAKGTGGASGNNAGNNGGDTTFTTTAPSSTTYTAGGGPGGNAGGSGLSSFPNISNGVGGGSATGGDDNMPGGGSFAGVVQTSSIANSGGGGYSRYGFGGYGSLVIAANSTQAAFNATGKGGGGGSAVSAGSGSAQAGGDGTDGMVLIWEYR